MQVNFLTGFKKLITNTHLPATILAGQQLKQAMLVMQATKQGQATMTDYMSLITAYECDIDDSSTLFFVNSKTLVGCTDPPSKASAHPISVLSEAVASNLCYLMLTCIHPDDSTHSFRYVHAQVIYFCNLLEKTFAADFVPGKSVDGQWQISPTTSGFG